MIFKEITFNTYRNSLRRIIYLARKDYICKKNCESKNNTKNTWQTLNKALNRSPSQFSPETLTIDNQICTKKNGWPTRLIIISPQYVTEMSQ